MGDWDVVSTKPVSPSAPVSSTDPWAVVGTKKTGATAEPDAPYRLFGDKPMDPVFGTVVAPALNLIDYPVRGLAADVIAAIPGIGAFPHNEESRRQFWEKRDRILKATEVPETQAGQTVSQVLSYPGQIVGAIAGAASRSILGQGVTDVIAPFATTAADAAPMVAGKYLSRGVPQPLPGKPSERLPAAAAQREEAKATRVEDKARKEISKEYSATSYEGGATATDMMDTIQKARASGQPMILADLSHSLERLGGSVYRAGGAASTRIRDFLERRQSAASQRMNQAVDGIFTDTSYRDLMKLQADARAAHAKPVWTEAMAHGSTAPFERQYQLEWGELGKQKAAAQAELAAAQSEMTMARARQTTASNVYATSGANTGARQANGRVANAQAKVAEIEAKQNQRMDLLRKAQEDNSLNAPGATWSPGLQHLEDHFPEIRKFMANGIAIERRFAANDILHGERFNPRDYAIVGKDAAGEPIIGTVATMRAWHAAKVGIDNFLSSDAAHDALTGRLNAMGASYANLKRVMVSELDRLNPKYKPARDLYAGDTAILRAANDGKRALTNRFADEKEIHEYLADASSSERQAFITGMAQDLSNRLDRMKDSQDRSRLVSDDFTRKRVQAVLGDAEANRFLDIIDREHTMKVTGNRTLGGSPSAERIGADVQRALEGPSRVWDVLDAALHLRPVSTLKAAGRLIKGSGKRPQPVTDAMGRLLYDPSITFNVEGELLPQSATPRAPRPAQSYLMGTILQPQSPLPSDNPF